MHDVWVLRHGESTANVEGVIVSVPGPRALTDVGLTALGREQAQAAARWALEQGLGADAVIISSDFARARQTAEVFADGIGAVAPRLDERLRERSFGTHDEGPASSYDLVWDVDRERGVHEDQVEAVAAVATRVDQVLREADELTGDAPVVLVAHGDVLQITLALGVGLDPHDHRDVPHLGNAELRRVGGARLADSSPTVAATEADTAAATAAETAEKHS